MNKIPKPTKSDQTYDVLCFPDGRKIVRMHRFESFSVKQICMELGVDFDVETDDDTNETPKEKPPKEKDFMTLKNHNKTLKRVCKKLWSKSYPNIYFFVHLTTAQPKTFDELNQMFFTFMKSVRYNFGKNVQYARAIEPPRKIKDPSIIHNHIHAIIKFLTPPKNFDKNWVEKYWNYGIVKVDKITEIYGAIEYITKIKPMAYKVRQTAVSYTNPAKTYIPNNTRLITTSRNFGVQENYKVETLSHPELEALLMGAERDKIFVRIDGHYYKNHNSKNFLDYCLDRIYLKPLKNPPPKPLKDIF